MDNMTSILKNLIIIALALLVLIIANDNRQLQARNAMLESNLHSLHVSIAKHRGQPALIINNQEHKEY